MTEDNKNPDTVRQKVLQALKDISNGAARSSKTWVHEGPRSFLITKRNSKKLPANELEQLIKVVNETNKEIKRLVNEIKELKEQIK